MIPVQLAKVGGGLIVAAGTPVVSFLIYDYVNNSFLSSLDKKILENIKNKTFTIGEFSDVSEEGSDGNKSVSSEISVTESSDDWKCIVKAVAVKSGDTSVDLNSSKSDLKTSLSNVLTSQDDTNTNKKWYFVRNCALNRGKEKLSEGKESTLVLKLKQKGSENNKWEFEDLDKVFSGYVKNFS